MKQWGKASILLLAFAIMVVLSACGNKANENNNTAGGNKTSNQEGETNQAGSPEPSDATKNLDALKGKKIALIMQFNTGTFSSQYIQGVKDQVTKFGGEVQVFAADNDLAKMASNLDAAINQGFDGILIDHGQAGALEAGVKRAVEQKIQVIAFDADLKVPEVTVLQQDDAKLTEMTLNKLSEDAGGKGSIVKVWVAGFAPMERRNVAYKAFLDSNPDFKEIAAFGNANNPAMDAQSQMEAVLKKYPNKGDITAVWASWDEFAKGATRAIQQAGRTEIKVYGIDMSDEDLQLIQDSNSPWVASAAVDPISIGSVQVRYLYQKFNGDQTDETVVLEPTLVKREDLPALPEKVNTTQLSEHVEGWGSSEQGYTDLLKELEASTAK
ncbi:sugar ABC transporter substrate-binding protein [Paenibacillus nasutitermitis]|uniref:Methylthioribose-binding protein n=1 Tax=Paenibacillus nasutitermitis TaxID=1652958 RepID=A0A916Z0Z2_9BACL|nr:sugar ABC transporter substrate-binding protein [Paenibacillus nasutitermitis]GGD69268.1 methylthioribose-binding protein [Paenibacillus nasutitermitis]